ncbi:MAG: hypothetical protein AMJ62_09155 [Myxococcales bacterium SG8_38]|nr:MAG: hypothetical protein AMJ62_09155 [Myxococcales bacterium SG8_38]
MLVYLLSFAAFVLVALGLGVGQLLGRGGIRGSCGGLNGPGQSCGLCGRGAAETSDCPRKAS